jgi:hypothetical protein
MLLRLQDKKIEKQRSLNYILLTLPEVRKIRRFK